MKKALVPIVIGVLFLMIPAMAMGMAFTGSIQGFFCVTQGKVCPIGKEDPMVAAEQVFVLLADAEKNIWYYVPNVDRAVLARHINDMVSIEGFLNKNLNSIKAKEIYVMGADKSWKKVWSQDWQDEIYRDVLGSHPLSPESP